MKYLVLYMAPAANLEAWLNQEESVRKEQEKEMMAAWDVWMEDHKTLFTTVAGAGKTKRVTKEGVADVKNDVMLYAIAEADSQEAIAEAFKDNPHFGIPDAWIDIMPINPLPGMEV